MGVKRGRGNKRKRERERMCVRGVEDRRVFETAGERNNERCKRGRSKHRRLMIKVQVKGTDFL